ncbi:hypothetical protein PCANC_20309 [Puccinia coronata f. sp. avenae]|uniref:Uncharacterized protein n=1 Tax=Puccinia coronata f. sp. avenae TaxID=200324 RepID=A0A2N5TEK8_9BASI|nr:hypothetical protein PCANC_20309 [Puccinia coronata f. sp. avenae]PLW23879.1 hypothetical protein PCASD_13505 [Puccinia coronata f. sp. avenae]
MHPEASLNAPWCTRRYLAKYLWVPGMPAPESPDAVAGVQSGPKKSPVLICCVVFGMKMAKSTCMAVPGTRQQVLISGAGKKYG